eukprot:CAMPEP_0183358158 /NCGR_PEP_ID=MMETSP0164_2-20130417/48366_1 /TAXON_ID=221442 /ORGANISM="Coccolithus pelagicus ssp braarudi, Strain PLY182g" /LENGTH=40 /DNA_ID= /DNA_START= /DNA_END= /DNA_ORIENTATION=
MPVVVPNDFLQILAKSAKGWRYWYFCARSPGMRDGWLMPK